MLLFLLLHMSVAGSNRHYCAIIGFINHYASRVSPDIQEKSIVHRSAEHFFQDKIMRATARILFEKEERKMPHSSSI